MPLVSVIVPNYNHAPFLRQRIDSVLNQTFQDFELIILDDCSTDDSRDIIALYQTHPKISHIVLNENNSGSPFYQWRKGFELAKGKYIWIAESDDYASNVFLRDSFNSLSRNEEIGLVYCDALVVDEKNEKVAFQYDVYKNDRFHTNKWSSNYLIDGRDEIASCMYLECTINNMSGVVFKRDLLQFVDYSKLFLFSYSGDRFFLNSIISHCKVCYIAQKNNYFRRAESNFKKESRTSLQYLKERFLNQYLLWFDYSVFFNKTQKKAVYTQLGANGRQLLSGFMKGNYKYRDIYEIFHCLKRINSKLFIHNLLYTIKSYI